MKLVLDINPQWFSDNLVTKAAIAVEPLSDILQKLVIDGIKNKLQPLLEERIILSIEANVFFKGTRKSFKEIIEKGGYIFEHFRVKIETSPNVVIEKQDVLLPTNLRWLPKDGYVDHIFMFRKTPLKTRNRYLIEIYNLLIPATLLQPTYNKFYSNCICPSHDLSPVDAIVWTWWIEFGCKVCGKTYFCDCFRPALEKYKKVAFEQVGHYADEGWPHDFLSAMKRAVFRPRICHLCTGTKPEMIFCDPMYGSGVMVNYGAYVRKTAVEHDIDERHAENIVRDKLGIPRIKKSVNISAEANTLLAECLKQGNDTSGDDELGKSIQLTLLPREEEDVKDAENNTTAAEYWQQSKAALSNNEMDKAAQLAFQARKKEAESKGYDFSENSPLGNPLHAKKAASEIENLEIPIRGISGETKAKLKNELAFGILKGENPRATERRIGVILNDFEWLEFDQLCNKFMSMNEWPPLWETVAAYHKMQTYPIEALLHELRKEELVELAECYSVNIEKCDKKKIIIKSLANVIPDRDRANILTLVNKIWKPRYLREKRFLLTHTLSNQAFRSAAVSEFDAAERVLDEEIKVQWWTARDGRVCSICASRHGKIYTKAEVQELTEPCLNCRCAQLPYLESWKELNNKEGT